MRGVRATSSSSPAGTPAGHILAVLSLGEPVSGRRPSDAELDYLVAVGASAACALDHGQRAQEAARHRAALEELLAVSSRLACQDSIELVLEAVCAGVVRALGFAKVVIELIDPDDGIAAAPRQRRLAGRPGAGLDGARGGHRAAARPGVRDRRLLPAPRGHGARARAAVR